MRQCWETITFLHWHYPIDVVQAVLPPDFEVEPWDGAAWVGLLPFSMRVSPPIGPPIPFVTTFPETNVRTYVRGPDGQPGIWFFSLDAANIPAVAAGRIGYGLPYFPARMRVRRHDGTVEYSSHRLALNGHRPGHDIVVAPHERIAENKVDAFDLYLTARFLLWTTHRGWIRSIPAVHRPWPLRRARLDRLTENLVESAGLPAPGSAPIVHYSDGVDVRLGRSRRHRLLDGSN